MTLPPLPEPFDYCYEWETGYGIVRKFSATPHHGIPPTRTVALYTADQMRAALSAHVPESELRAVIDRCYAEFCGRDYMHLPLDEALRAALAAVPAGWALVPVEPTGAMRDAANTLPEVFSVGDEYRAMLAAAPKEQPRE